MYRAIKRNIVIAAVLFFIGQNVYGQKIKRICISDNDLTIFWTEIADTCNGFVQYQLYGQSNAFDSFAKIAVIKDKSVTEYIHIGAKNKSLNWKYFIKTDFICNGKSFTIISDTQVIDQVLPDPVEIDSLSVNYRKLVLGWEKCKSSDAKGYLLFYVDNNGNNVIFDTVYGKENTFYTMNNIADPDNRISRICIAPLDSCNNIGKISGIHNNVLLNVSLDSCNSVTNLSWNPYSFWNGTEYQVEIYEKIDNGEYARVGIVNGNILQFGSQLKENHKTYYYYLRCRNLRTGFTTTSNIFTIRVDFVEDVDEVYLSNVTDLDKGILLSWHINKTADLKEFRIYRGTDMLHLNSVYEIIYDGKLDYEYTDTNIDINSVVYYYRIATVDNCLKERKNSNTSNNILLAKKESNEGYSLNWNKYEKWYGGVKGYTIFKKDEDSPLWLEESNVSATVTEYKSNLSNYEVQGKSICFYVRAQEGDTNKYGLKEQSSSNIVCLMGDPVVYIPNAFVPDGVNKYFKPNGTLINWKDSKMEIYNRWGARIWSDNLNGNGWDGKDSGGNLIQGGVFFYMITIMGENGKKKNYNGSLNLIR